MVRHELENLENVRERLTRSIAQKNAVINETKVEFVGKQKKLDEILDRMKMLEKELASTKLEESKLSEDLKLNETFRFNKKVELEKVMENFDKFTIQQQDFVNILRTKESELASFNQSGRGEAPEQDSNQLESDLHIADLPELLKDESSFVEYKSSLIVPVEIPHSLEEMKSSLKKITDSAQRNELLAKIKQTERDLTNELEVEVMKTIAGFLNSNSGVLLIGVRNDGTVTGIEVDYERFSKGKNFDSWLQHFKNLVKNDLGLNSIPYIHVNQIMREGKTVARIEVDKASGPIHMSYKLKGIPHVDFFIRAYNTTEALDPREFLDYYNTTWGPGSKKA